MHEDDPPPTELRQGLEEFYGKPLKVSPQEGVKNATEDIAYLGKQKLLINQAVRAGNITPEDGAAELARLDKELLKAQQMLASYENQIKTRN